MFIFVSCKQWINGEHFVTFSFYLHSHQNATKVNNMIQPERRWKIWRKTKVNEIRNSKLTHLDRCLSFGFVRYTLKTWKCTKLVDYLHLNCYDSLTRSNFLLLTFYLFCFYFFRSRCLLLYMCHQLSNINMYGANARNLFGLVGSLRLILCRHTYTHWMRETERENRHTNINSTTEYEKRNGKLYGLGPKMYIYKDQFAHSFILFLCRTMWIEIYWRHCIA